MIDTGSLDRIYEKSTWDVEKTENGELEQKESDGC